MKCKKEAAKNFSSVFNLNEKYNQDENHKEVNRYIGKMFVIQKNYKRNVSKPIEEFILQESKDSLLRLEMNEIIVFKKIYINFFKILIDDIEKKSYSSDEYKFIKQYIERNKK